MLDKEQVKDIIVALINNGYFPKYSKDEAENLGKDISKFIKTFVDETKNK